jgi:hypothetical protein
MLAEVSMTAGRCTKRQVDVNFNGSSTGTHIVNATIEHQPRELEPDWAIGTTLDLMTDTMSQIYQLNATRRFTGNIDTFVRVTLESAYDAT